MRKRSAACGLLVVAVTTSLSLVGGFSSYASADTVQSYSQPGVGTALIADYDNDRIISVTPDGTQSTVVSGIQEPGGTALDSEGDLFYPSAGSANDVEEVSTSGQLTGVGSQFQGPTGVAVDNSGNVFIADDTGNQVDEVTALGAQTEFAAVSHPVAVAVDPEGDVYVAENGTLTGVVEYPAGGGQPVTVISGLQDADGVVADTSGDVFVSDPVSNKVTEVLAGSGTTKSIGTGLVEPSGLALNASGDLFISELGTADGEGGYSGSTVVEVTPSGTQSTVTSDVDAPVGLAVYAPPPTLTAESPPTTGVVGTAYAGYSYSADVATGEPTATFAVATGSLPPGLTLDPGTGELSGTPTAGGNYSFSIAAENAVSGSVGPTTTISVAYPSLPSVPVAGDIFVADSQNNDVVETPPGNGTPVDLDPGLNDPTAVAVDDRGNVYVADAGNDRIVEMPADGDPAIDKLSGLTDLTGVAVDEAGDVFAVEGGADGEIVELPVGGSQMPIVSGLNSPGNIALDDEGDIFIADAGGNNVLELDHGAASTSVFASGLSRPIGVAVDSSGDVYVAAVGNGDIYEFAPDGTNEGLVRGDLSSPEGLAVDANGDLFFSDTEAQFVTEIDSNGHVSGVGSDWGAPMGIAVFAPPPSFVDDTPPATAMVGTPYSYGITFDTPSGENAPTLSVVDGSLPPGLTLDASNTLTGTPTQSGSYTFTLSVANQAQASFSAPITIMVSGASGTVGRVYVSDFDNHVLLANQSQAGGTQVSGKWDVPTGLALDNAGDLFVANEGNSQVVKMTPSGSAEITRDGFKYPTAVAVSPAGDLYVADTFNNRVVEVTPSGTKTTILSGVKEPAGVAVDAAGDVFVASFQSGDVVELVPGKLGLPTLLSGLDEPAGIAVDSAGDLFVAEYGANKVVELPHGATRTQTVGSDLTEPAAVALDASGDLFIADGSGIVEVQPRGTQALFDGHVDQPIGLAVSAPAPTFTRDSAPENTDVGQPYSYTFAATAPAGEPAPTFRVASGFLPPGLSLNPATGVLSGTPTTSDQYEFAIQAENAANAVAVNATIKVVGPPIFATGTPPEGTVGKAYNYQFRAFSYPAPTYSISTGGLPPGLTLNHSTGVVSGKPTKSGSYDFVVEASNGNAPDAKLHTSIAIKAG